MIHLDTHVVVWLAAGDLDRFELFVVPLLQQRGCAILPMVILELDYLHEIGRLKVSGAAIIQDLAADIGLVIDGSSFEDIVSVAAQLTWTRDPFDRIICATVRLAGAPLFTRDGDILDNEPSAFWEHLPV